MLPSIMMYKKQQEQEQQAENTKNFWTAMEKLTKAVKDPREVLTKAKTLANFYDVPELGEMVSGFDWEKQWKKQNDVISKAFDHIKMQTPIPDDLYEDLYMYLDENTLEFLMENQFFGPAFQQERAVKLREAHAKAVGAEAKAAQETVTAREMQPPKTRSVGGLGVDRGEPQGLMGIRPLKPTRDPSRALVREDRGGLLYRKMAAETETAETGVLEAQRKAESARYVKTTDGLYDTVTGETVKSFGVPKTWEAWTVQQVMSDQMTPEQAQQNFLDMKDAENRMSTGKPMTYKEKAKEGTTLLKRWYGDEIETGVYAIPEDRRPHYHFALKEFNRILKGDPGESYVDAYISAVEYTKLEFEGTFPETPVGERKVGEKKGQPGETSPLAKPKKAEPVEEKNWLQRLMERWTGDRGKGDPMKDYINKYYGE
jgi:hypothetical protein